MGGGFDDGGGGKSGPTEVPVDYGFSGEAWVVRGGSRIPLKTSKEGKIKFQDNDHLVTGNGFIWGVKDECRPEGKERESAWLELFPNSEAKLSILDFEKKEEGGRVLGQLITGIELVRGLFWLKIESAEAIEKKLRLPSGCPQVEFKPDAGEFGRVKELTAFLGIDGNAITIFSTHGRILHKGLGIEVRPDRVGDAKITITQGAVYLANLVETTDMRITLARKMHKYLVAGSLKSGPASIDDSALYSLPPFSAPSEADRVIKREATRSSPNMDMLLDDYKTKLRAAESEMIEKRLAREKAFNEEYEGAPESIKAKAHRAIEKENSEDYKKYSQLEKQMGERLLENEKAFIESGKKGITATTKKASVNGKITFHEVVFEFSGVDRGIEMGFSKSKIGQEYLMLKFKVKNSSKKQVFLSPDEEFHLLCGTEQIPLKNYKLETNMGPGYSGEGHFLFVVSETASSFKLQAGKKLENKLEFAFNA